MDQNWYRVWWLLVGGDNIWIKVIHWSFLQCWIESGQKDKGRMFGSCFLTHYNVDEEPGAEPVGTWSMPYTLLPGLAYAKYRGLEE